MLEAARFTSLRDSIVLVLGRANAVERSPEAVELIEHGTVTIGDAVYGGPAVRGFVPQLFEKDGTLTASRDLAAFLATPTLPEWAPASIVSTQTTPILICVVSLAIAIIAGLSGAGSPCLLAVMATLAVAVPAWFAGSLVWVVASLGAGATLILFILSTRVALVALSGSSPICAVAQGVVREALRLRVAAFFMGAILVLIPLLVVWIGVDQPLRYQVQTFLSRSTGLLYALAACMTLFLACATVSTEMRDRQIWHTLTKPVNRFQYMIGKWLGIVALNAAIMTVGSVSIFGFLQYIQTRPAKDILDASSVREEVLVARDGVLPAFEVLSRERLIEIIDQTIESDPDLREQIDSGAKREMDVRRTLAQEKMKAFLTSQRTLDPGQSREYTFTGLKAARASGRPISLRYELHAGAEDSHETHPFIFRFPINGSWTDRRFVAGQVHLFVVPPDLITEDGKLVVELANVAFEGDEFLSSPTSINFDPDGLEVLFPVASFESNFIRMLAVDLSKLTFLAMLGVSAATILSFPIACLLAFTVFAIGSLSPFLTTSIDYYGATANAPAVIQWTQIGIKAIAASVNWLLGGFGAVDATESLVRGRLISSQALVRVVGGIGFAWTAMALVIGFLLFRRKEVALYSGQG